MEIEDIDVKEIITQNAAELKLSQEYYKLLNEVVALEDELKQALDEKQAKLFLQYANATFLCSGQCCVDSIDNVFKVMQKLKKDISQL